MFCVECGSQVKDGNKFCPKCGSAVDGSAPTSSAGASEQPVAQSVPKHAPSAEEKNYYEILEVLRTASTEEIQEAIKKQRTLWSSRVPRGGSMGERARQIVEIIGMAEATLLDAKKRSAYDETLKEKTDYQVVIPSGEKNWLEVLYSYYDQKDWDMAVEAVDRATKQQGDNPETWFLAANVYLAIEDYNKANKAAQQVLLLEPDNPTAYGIRGDVLLIKKGGSAKQAIEMYSKMKALAKDAETRKTAEEAIVVANATIIGAQADSIINDLSREFTYNKETMAILKNYKEQAEGIKAKMEQEYNKISNPSSWIQNVKSGDIQDCNELINGIQELIDDGNKPVLLPGFWGGIVGMVVGIVIGFAVMSADPGLGFGVMLVLGGGFAIRAFYICRKPAWKAESAFLYKFIRS